MISELRMAGWPMPMTHAELDERLSSARPMVARLHNARPSPVAASYIPPRMSEATLNAPARIRDVLAILEAVSSEVAANINALSARVVRLEGSR
jgi:hypothetical protein